MTRYQYLTPEERSRIAYHEAGHAVAHILAFHRYSLPESCVKYAGIVTYGEDSTIGGACYGTSPYRPQWDVLAPDVAWRDAMEWQIIIVTAGSVAEAIHRGERRPRDVLWVVMTNSGTESDLDEAEAVLADLRKLTGRRFGLAWFTLWTLDLLLENWDAVEEIAQTIIRYDYIDGDVVKAIVDGARP